MSTKAGSVLKCLVDLDCPVFAHLNISAPNYRMEWNPTHGEKLCDLILDLDLWKAGADLSRLQELYREVKTIDKRLMCLELNFEEWKDNWIVSINILYSSSTAAG